MLRLWARVRPHAIAAFVTFHLTCVLVYVVPYPPRFGRKVFENRDVREEIDRAVTTFYDLFGRPGTRRAFRKRALGAVADYTRAVLAARSLAGVYIEPVGETQNWNMFGGIPPRHPLIGMIEVKPRGARHYKTWLDGHWGQSGDAAFDFRHRKAQETLFLASDPAPRREYAAYWAHRWQREHPGTKLRALRFYYVETTTLAAKDVRAGAKAARERRVRVTTWRAKPRHHRRHRRRGHRRQRR